MDTPQRYSTDLSHAERAQVQRVIPAPKPGGRPARYHRRERVNALSCLARAGCPWRMPPKDLPPWTAVYGYFRAWTQDGILDHLRDLLRGDLRQAEGRQRPPAAAILDSPSVKTTEKGRVRGHDRGKKVKGRKWPILVDTLGLILAVVVPAADFQDRDGAKLVWERLKHRFSRPRRIGADGGSAGTLRAWVGALRRRGKPRRKLVKRSEEAEGFAVLPKRWIVERTFAGRGRWRRLSQDYEGTTSSSEAFIKRASIHRMTRRLVRKLAENSLSQHALRRSRGSCGWMSRLIESGSERMAPWPISAASSREFIMNDTLHAGPSTTVSDCVRPSARPRRSARAGRSRPGQSGARGIEANARMIARFRPRVVRSTLLGAGWKA